jgi:hypothetical protein
MKHGRGDSAVSGRGTGTSSVFGELKMSSSRQRLGFGLGGKSHADLSERTTMQRDLSGITRQGGRSTDKLTLPNIFSRKGAHPGRSLTKIPPSLNDSRELFDTSKIETIVDNQEKELNRLNAKLQRSSPVIPEQTLKQINENVELLVWLKLQKKTEGETSLLPGQKNFTEFAERIKWCKQQCETKRTALTQLRSKNLLLKKIVAEKQLPGAIPETDLNEVGIEELKLQIEATRKSARTLQIESEELQTRKQSKLNELKAQNDRLRQAIAALNPLVQITSRERSQELSAWG